MNLDQALQTFFGESRELLDDMEQSLLSLGQAGEADEQVNAIFRAAHTIKGSAGLFGLDAVVSFTHVVESVLDLVRDDRQRLNEDLIGLLLASRDHIGLLLSSAAGSEVEPGRDIDSEGARLVACLRNHMNGPMHEEVEVTLTDELAPGPVHDIGHWHISLRFHRDTLRHGMDPLSFLRYLGRMGDIVHVITLADAMPADADMDPETCYLGFEIALRAATDRSTIESVFEFVSDDCDIRILDPGSSADAYRRLINSLPEDNERLEPIFALCGVMNEDTQGSKSDTGMALVPAAIELHRVFGKEIPQGTAQSQVRGEARSIRVDADRLDQLIDQIGELIIASAGTSLVASRSQDAQLQEWTATMSSMVQAVRESALQLRMVKIAATFNRFQRVVHDTARECGKDIRLIVSGEDTELDKTVVEKIADPITHLVRNAIDHGIESAQQRLAAGKPAQGTIWLDAWHDSGSIVIRVSDDGAGLDRDRIKAKAVERGLVEAGRELSNSEVFELIFEPGFSTAERVTNLSGRGVGMDVVKRNITALRGSIAIESTPSVGTAISIRLPLTLAIIDGFLVEVGTSVFVIPLDSIQECIEFVDDGCTDFINLRGHVLPFIRLRDMFEVDGVTSRRQSIVVTQHAGRLVGLVVDSLIGEFQAVIKPLGKVFCGQKWVSGSTVLGNGKVALILDVPVLIEQAAQACAAIQKTTGQVATAA